MKIVFTLMLLLISVFCFSQQKNVYFLKNNGTPVNIRDSADFIREVRKIDSVSLLYNVTDYYKDGKKKLIGISSSNNPVRFEGECTTFNKDGKKEKVLNYKDGKIVGDEFDFYPNGKIYQVKEHLDTPDYDGLGNNYLLKKSYDSLGNVQIINGSGYFKGFTNDSTEVYEEGTIKNGKRDGSWKGGLKALHVTFTENYADGALITGTATYADGEQAVYTKARETYPQFKGGIIGFTNYISRKAHYPADARKNKIEGRVILTFIAGKDGIIKDVKVIKSVYPSIDDEAIRAVESSPKWIPGMQFGRPVQVAYSVPLNFVLTP